MGSVLKNTGDTDWEGGVAGEGGKSKLPASQINAMMRPYSNSSNDRDAAWMASGRAERKVLATGRVAPVDSG
jgi:hypothetical protein